MVDARDKISLNQVSGSETRVLPFVPDDFIAELKTKGSQGEFLARYVDSAVRRATSSFRQESAPAREPLKAMGLSESAGLLATIDEVLEENSYHAAVGGILIGPVFNELRLLRVEAMRSITKHGNIMAKAGLEDELQAVLTKLLPTATVEKVLGQLERAEPPVDKKVSQRHYGDLAGMTRKV